MRGFLHRFATCTSGVTAGEFALILPVVLIFLLGIVDAGRFMWEYNRAEKATQIGTRFAVVTNPAAPGLFAFDFTSVGVNAGDPVTSSALGTITCTSAGCTCATAPCPTGTGAPTGAWTQLLARMKDVDSHIIDSNVQVSYSASGLGYAGDPGGMDAVPLVRVSLTGMTFKPFYYPVFKSGSIPMPDFHASLTSEDSTGTLSN
jgi:Flp pilus assembly protein TadG